MLSLVPIALSQPVVLSEEATSLHTQMQALEAEKCEPVLQGVYDRLAPMRPEQVDLEDAQAKGIQTLDTLFQARIALQGRLTVFHAEGTLTPECIRGARRYGLATRYLADHLWLAGVKHDPWLTTDALSGADDLQAGDLLVTRGAGLSSSGVAHMGRIDSQFSHNAMVHVDEAGKKWTVEAYLEKGAHVQPLEDFLTHGLGRIVVIRYEDPALAAKGAALSYERIANGDPIDYDEAFDRTNADELFCSEIGPWSIALAGGPTDLPYDLTRFPQEENPKFFAAMGITGDVLAAPADLLYDPRFRIVGEWRALEHLEEMRRQDVVVESLTAWMEDSDYVVDPRWADKTTVNAGLVMRRTPLIRNAVIDRIHPNGERAFLITGLALQNAGEYVYGELNARIDADPGMRTRDEMLAMVETIRAEDHALWTKKKRKARFHKWLHPAG